MYQIAPYESGVTLYCSNGTSQFYSSRRELFNALGWGVLRRCGGPACPYFGWQTIVKDADGNRLGAAAFVEFVTPKAVRKAQGNSQPVGVGPVPGTGVRSRSSCMRYRLKTTQERRLHAFYDADTGEPKPRARRIGSNLPSTYDDKIRSDADARNWKHYRKHQWKA